MTDRTVSLSNKYERERGTVFLSGLQALVRLPLVQIRRDRAAGLNTAGFISGYRGSPLGGYDLELNRARKYLDAHDVAFEPGLNEDLAATAVWGTQQLHLDRNATRDGVFGIWYGKGPGLDRSMDVMRHGNAEGTAPRGGVLCIVGDDHAARSSTLPHQADHNFMAAFMPVLYPSGVHEFVEFGLYGIAMSRYSGCWVGVKATSDTAEGSGVVDLEREWRKIVLPQDFEMPPGGVHIRWPDPPREVDFRLQRYKGFAALAFARANNIDRIVWDSPNPRFGIMTSGKSYQDVREALHELGIDQARAGEIGLRLYKVGMPWPLEPQGARHFCEGLDEVLVVEEKREMIEHQLKWQLFNWREEVRPTVVGKHDEKDAWLLPPENNLTVGQIAHVIAERLARLHDSPQIRDKLRYFRSREDALARFTAPIARTPYFCSGCPHNTSTKVPVGSRAMGGIGCHYMAAVIDMDRRTELFTQMGGEGVPWIGQCRFTKDEHLFVNLGDGTYQHSGSLAIRAAVAAGINITYKILFNDAVAMTGGQPLEGNLTVDRLVAQLQAEGVAQVYVVGEETELAKLPALPGDVPVEDRRFLDDVQRKCRETKGVTCLVYVQTCAAEKRRRRKRGRMEDPPKRVFINAAVCEGCGDCSVQSNCLSIEPLETAFGRKRQINQSTCNKDYSCLQGFCPSFVTVHGGELASSLVPTERLAALAFEVPEPDPLPIADHYNLIVTGIGGTGVVTIGAVLGMAAHMEGRRCLVSDMAGLAQKGGAVYSHVRIADDPDVLHSPRIMTGGADLLLACDGVVAASPEIVDLLNAERTGAVLNAHTTPVADFVHDRNLDFKASEVERVIGTRVRQDAFDMVRATGLALAIGGDSIGTHMVMLGYGFQKGWIPLRAESIRKAIELNGTAVEVNLDLFAWGRRAASEPAAVDEILSMSALQTPDMPETLDDIIAHRVRHLSAYQDAAYAERYRSLIDNVRRRVAHLGSEGDAFV